MDSGSYQLWKAKRGYEIGSDSELRSNGDHEEGDFDLGSEKAPKVKKYFERPWEVLCDN